MTDYLLRLPWPSPSLSSNSRVHWATKASAVKNARWEACLEAKQRRVATIPDAVLAFEFFPPDRRHRDVHNMPTAMKAYIDGIAQAMGCDDKGFRVQFPDRFAAPVSGGRVLVHIKPGEQRSPQR